MDAHTIHYSTSVDLHYSVEDGGWYAQNYDSDRTTGGIYASVVELTKALDEGVATWES